MARILVVDDEENILQLLRTILQIGGHDVLSAVNQADGFDLLRRESVDLLLLDLRIGEFDGRDFFHGARANGYMGRIVIISAFGAVRAARELGADGAIEKPFDPADLMDEIERILALHRPGANESSEPGTAALHRLGGWLAPIRFRVRLSPGPA
ncbi:MAG: response regulator [Dehalococcoidia bacterium]|nr:response regulator [Dehalococcoidia bacterium]